MTHESDFVHEVIMASQIVPCNRISLFENLLVSASIELIRSIFKSWTLVSLLRLRVVNSQMRGVVDTFFDDAWDCNKFFGTWFKNPVHFRQLLLDKRAVVMGSQALSFFQRSLMLGSDLDIVVPVNEAAGFGMWLVESEGYNYDSAIINGKNVPHNHAFSNNVMLTSAALSAQVAILDDIAMSPQHMIYRSFAVFNFLKRKYFGTKVLQLKIQLLLTPGSAIEQVLNFHSSELGCVVLEYKTTNLFLYFNPSCCDEHNHLEQGCLFISSSNHH
jgi:hypothetical protein